MTRSATQAVIRPATADDFDSVSAILAETNRFHTALLPDRFQIAVPIMTVEWFDDMLHDPSMTMFVALTDGSIVGLLLMECLNTPDDTILVPRVYGYVAELAIAHSHHRQGIGQQLMTHAQTWAKERGATTIELHVWEANTGAIAFYEQLGYQTIQRTMRLAL
ncbi:MAG TPA: GNAT family N-acetyltransferase [Chroococcidiopsis sp.]